MSPQSRLADVAGPDITLQDVDLQDIELQDIARPEVPLEDVAEPVTAERVTTVALLNCLIREVAGPGGWLQAGDGPELLIELPGTGRLLRAGVRRESLSEPRLTGQVWQSDGDGWRTLGWRQVAELVDAELAASTHRAESPLITEVAASHAFVSEILDRRRGRAAQPTDQRADWPADYPADCWADCLASEQALVAGHRFHPAPKARSGPLTEAVRYAPETHSRFRLRYLAVPDELLIQHEVWPGAAAELDAVPGLDAGRLGLPAGHRLLPIHPWQHQILTRSGALPAALAAGLLVDLGELGDPVDPTSSVRTVARPDGAGYLKLSLAVQITNCLRVNPAHELQAAIAVSRLLDPIRAELAELFPGTLVLAENAARTVNFGAQAVGRRLPVRFGDELGDGLGVIAREGLRAHLPEGVTPLLAAALTEPAPIRVVAGVLPAPSAGRDGLLAWWESYLDLLLPPVLHAFLAHGVVFEAHLQNVLIAPPGLLVLRDLEGVKLVGPQHRATLAGLPPKVRDHLSYSPELGWDRVAYCLFVNHLSAVLAALADHDPAAESRLWFGLRTAIQRFQRDVGDAPQLRAVLAGVPLPAKTNLLTRWHQDADRDSGYLPVHLPLGPSPS